MDTIAILLPPMLFILITNGKKLPHAVAMIVGTVPFLVWELFSLVYYGFPFPNTAYVKLGTGISSKTLVNQGYHYLINSLSWDPVTLLSICGVVLYCLARSGKNPYNSAISVGILLYVAYVVRIGGDFMSGRLLTAPFVCSAFMIARIRLRTLCRPVLVLLLFSPLMVRLIGPTIIGDTYSYEPAKRDHWGVSDERGFYCQSTGLFRRGSKGEPSDHKWAVSGKKARELGLKVVAKRAIGLFGFYAGPTLHIIDRHGLADALLGRLPVQSSDEKWRIGHSLRDVPDGYPESVVEGNSIRDPNLAKYWDKLCIVTRNQLFSLERFREIWNLNTGKYDHLLDQCRRRKKRSSTAR